LGRTDEPRTGRKEQRAIVFFVMKSSFRVDPPLP
jgi:hypothetical protein